MNIHERIILAGEEAFFKCGVRSVTLDDLASTVGISKKTIYQHFKDKSELVLEVAKHRMEVDHEQARHSFENSENALHEMVVSSHLMRKMYAEMHPTLLSELKKFYPKAWQAYELGKKGFEEVIVRSIEAGIADGLIREGVNKKVLAKARLESIEMTCNSDIFPVNEYSFIETQECLLDHFIRGIVTEKGLKCYEEILRNMELEEIKQN